MSKGSDEMRLMRSLRPLRLLRLEILRPEKSLLRTSESSRFFNSFFLSGLEKNKFGRIMNYHVEF